jgi:hypothetical protein
MNFDPSVFLQATMTESLVRRPPIPAGTVLQGTLGAPEMRQSQGKQDPSKTYTFLDIPVEIDLTSNPAIRQHVGQDKVQLRWSCGVDLGPSGFDFSPGKNNGLRQLREALDLNKPGDNFSILMAQGRRVSVTIKNRPGAPGTDEVYDEVGAIARPA